MNFTGRKKQLVDWEKKYWNSLVLNPENILGWLKDIKNPNLHRTSNIIQKHLEDIIYKIQKKILIQPYAMILCQGGSRREFECKNFGPLMQALIDGNRLVKVQ